MGEIWPLKFKYNCDSFYQENELRNVKGVHFNDFIGQ